MENERRELEVVGSVEYPVPEITEEEVERAVRKMESIKAAGVCEVNIESWRRRGPMEVGNTQGSVEVREDTG